MKFFGWLLYIGSIVWGAMIIADPGKVAGLHFGDEDCEMHHHHEGGGLASLTCQRCRETSIHEGQLCKSCGDAEQRYMNVSGDTKPGIRLADVTSNSGSDERRTSISPYLGSITPFHLQFTVGSILLPLLIGTYCIFAVEHEKVAKK